MGETTKICENNNVALFEGFQDLTQRVIQLEEHFKFFQTRSSSPWSSESDKTPNPPSVTETLHHSNDSEIEINGSGLIDEFQIYVQGPDKEKTPLSYFREMMTFLSMPGWKFIGEQYRPRLHTYLWIFVHISSLLISYVYIKEENENWQKSPVLRTLSNNLTFVHDIPFPAITICLPPSIKEDYDYSGSLKKCFVCNNTKQDKECDFNKMCTLEEKALVAIASLICITSRSTTIEDHPWHVFQTNIQEYMTSEEFLFYSKKVFSPCDVGISQYRFTDNELYYSPIFQESGCYKMGSQHFVSQNGICFTINGIRHEDVFRKNTILSLNNIPTCKSGLKYIGKKFNLDTMLYLNGNATTIPVYMRGNQGLNIVINKRKYNVHNASCEYLNRFKRDPLLKIHIHNPVEVMFTKEPQFFLKHGEGKEILFIPELVTTDRALKNYESSDRGCYYSNERQLIMFKHYSESNCKTECVANCSLQHCGCVPYYLPRHNSSVRVCFSKCDGTKVCGCDCLPDCNSLKYRFESSNKKGNSSETAFLWMRYETESFYGTVRISFTTWSQFMAYCLGIVGVFNGFNVMIFYEILYYLTFKLWNSVKTYIKTS